MGNDMKRGDLKLWRVIKKFFDAAFKGEKFFLRNLKFY